MLMILNAQLYSQPYALGKQALGSVSTTESAERVVHFWYFFLSFLMKTSTSEATAKSHKQREANWQKCAGTWSVIQRRETGEPKFNSQCSPMFDLRCLWEASLLLKRRHTWPQIMGLNAQKPWLPVKGLWANRSEQSFQCYFKMK